MTYPEKLRRANSQKNYTIGRLVPFRDIPEYIWLGGMRLIDGAVQSMSMSEFLKLRA